MQVYADLRILTARPTPDEEGQAPHRLFGEIDGAVNYSVGRWAREARDVLAEIGERPVIFVGGTGLYLRALTEGLSEVPAVPEALRADVRRNAGGRATAELHAELAARDPETAARVTMADRQRILRALEGHGRDRAPARLVPRRARGAGACGRTNGRACSSLPIGPSLRGASTRGSTRCSERARSTRSWA